MASYQITAPVADFTGVVVGVAFADGTATVESKADHAALSYFRRRGYTVVVVDVAVDEVPKLTPAQEKAAAKKAADEEEAARKAAEEAAANGGTK